MESIATWVAPVATTIAALMTALNLGTRITGYGFVVFTIGSLAWLALGVATGQPALLWQNIILTLLNLIGIWRWLGRQARIEDGGRAAQHRSEAAPGETLFPAALLARAPVLSAVGEELGHAVEAMAGCRSGRIAYVVVAEGGVAGVGESLRRLDWDGLRVEGEALMSAIDRRAFAALPLLERDRWPGR